MFARLLLLSLFSTLALAPTGDATDLWPGVEVDPAIPTFEQILGHAPGERIVSHGELLRYFDALSTAAPDRLRVTEYARSWQGRALVYVVVGSAANLARIDSVQEGYQRLADPRATSAEEAAGWIEQLPALVWLAYGVHGNEISSPDAAMLTAYLLLAARNEPAIDAIRKDAVVVLDPLQNPDGRDRFVHNFRSNEGIVADPDRLAAEHDEPWPGGRTNHYLFDLNRDWFALTQPETRGRVQALQEWYPLIFVDLHEMGGDSSYYFAPDAAPANPHLAVDQRADLEIIGRNNARWFDRFGFDYFTREIYDSFYPGYGASWPAFFGASSATYEEASARGLVLLREDGELMHFRDTVQRHLVASIATAETAAGHRQELLRHFRAYRTSALEEAAAEGIAEIVLPYHGDTSAVDKLAGLLVRQGVEVQRATAPLQSCGVTLPIGSYVVPLAQPAKRLIRNLLDAEVSMEPEFLDEQERRRAKRLRDQIYDVTAWSLPRMYGVTALPCASVSLGDREPAGPELILPGRAPERAATVAYLVPWGTRAAGRLLARALGEGAVVLSADAAFSIGDRDYPAGSLIFKVEDNSDDLRSHLGTWATETGADVFATDTSWVDGGVNFGSRRVVRVHPPRIALAWDSPVSSNSAGATRFVLERQFGIPVTVIRVSTLVSADLRRYQTLILPAARGSWRRAFGDSGLERLRDWVEAGGTLIALDNAVELLADEDLRLLSTESEELAVEGGPSAPSGQILATPEEYQAAIQPGSPRPDAVPGVLLRADVDPDHWIGAGVAESLHVLYGGRLIYRPLSLDKGVNAVHFAAPERLLASGYLWEENARQLAFKPFVMVQQHGRGLVIGFTSDPNQRAYLDGLNVLFLNAVLRGPAHARPLQR